VARPCPRLLPIARLADRHSRRLIIGVGIAFWSVMSALSGIAQSYVQLFWARVAAPASPRSPRRLIPS
jgi:MFS family permease